MKRNVDCIRDILLAIEASPQFAGAGVSVDGEALGLAGKYDRGEILYNTALLVEAKFLDGVVANSGDLGIVDVVVFKISWQGHDFIETVRDPAVYRKAKEAASRVGTFTLDVLAAIAKGFVIAKLKGIGVDLEGAG